MTSGFQMAGFIFYGSWFSVLVLILVGVLIEKFRIRWLNERRRTRDLEDSIRAKIVNVKSFHVDNSNQQKIAPASRKLVRFFRE
jgi:hypothetical protein